MLYFSFLRSAREGVHPPLTPTPFGRQDSPLPCFPLKIFFPDKPLSVVIPGLKGHYLKAHVDCDYPIADIFLFEPHMLSALGVCAQESLFHNQDDGTVLVLFQNYQAIAMHMEAGALLREACPLDSDCGVLTLDEATHLPPLADENVC